MKKQISFILAIVLICALLVSCMQSGPDATAEESATPQQAQVQAGEAPPPTADDEITPADYTDKNNWLHITGNPEKPVDVFYLYPTAWTRQEGEPYYCEIDNESMRKGAPYNLLSQASAYEDAGNIFAPYYRQLDAAYLLQLPLEEQMPYVYGVPYTDVVAAFEYFIENYNDGRPFILAGHSQGSEMISLLLKTYFKEHPDVYQRMVAAYVIGYSITQQDLDENPHIRFAENATDTGVVISYNTEAPAIDGKSPVALSGSVAINPINWKKTEEPASAEQNLGSRFYDRETGEYEDVANLADAAVNLERGTVICSTVDIDEYSLEGMEEVFPRGVFHGSDYPFYYHNIRENAQRRAEKYLFENSDGHVVETNYGPVKGSAWDGVVSYKGVPFALSPVGEYRFSPPQPAVPWTDVLACDRFMTSPVQAKEEVGQSYSEDCLYLNIWTPEELPAEPMPVLVFIHGGAFTQGSASKGMYDGSRFAKDGVIQVNIAYRLNGLGFFVSEELEEENGYIGNAGMLDQIAGLKWVKENIEHFGGDPDNITISGESAGSFSVSNLILSPLADGLFSRAILESGNVLGQPVVSPYSNGSSGQALENAARLMESLGTKTLQDMRVADAFEIAKQSNYEMNMLAPSDKAFFPVFDGKILPENPYEALMSGNYNQVDILAGYNTDEGTLFIEDDISAQDYAQFAERIFGENADAVLTRYPVDEANTATDRARFIVKMGLRMGSDIFADKLSADGQDAYLYHFDYTVPALDAIGLGTMHALELPFVFDTFSATALLTEQDQAFMDEVHGRWVNFIKNGDPNMGVSFDTEWEKYTAEAKQTMVLSESSHMATAENAEDIEFFMSLIWE